MIHLIFSRQTLLITIPLITLAASNFANAEIYKWRDSQGTTQYSDRPPVDSFSKITRNELVNSLQTKDLCVDGPIVKSAASSDASSKDYSGLFTSFFKTKNATTKPAISIANRINSYKNNVTVLGFSKTPTKPIQVVTAPPAIKPPKPDVITTPPPATPSKPDVVTPPVSKPAEPVATTPPAPTNPNTSPNIIQKGLMPAVDISKNIIPAVGFADLRIKPTTEAAPASGGEFRVGCAISHMSNDDPILYPNQQGAAHHHTFYGNTSVTYKSDLMNFANTGNSTCSGGIMNRSAYWAPSMIDTTTNTPLTPLDGAIFYYKTGNLDGSIIKVPPKGLRMIAGDMKRKDDTGSARGMFSCHPSKTSKRNTWPWNKGIPSGANCEPGDTLEMAVTFPQCWDGKNLDSPNHQDHMAYALRVGNTAEFACPATHKTALPEISIHLKFKATPTISKWRLSSDNYSASLPGGYSTHADWVNGWDQKVLEGIVKNCLNGKKDAHAHLLCDGRMFHN